MCSQTCISLVASHLLRLKQYFKRLFALLPGFAQLGIRQSAQRDVGEWMHAHVCPASLAHIDPWPFAVHPTIHIVVMNNLN